MSLQGALCHLGSPETTRTSGAAITSARLGEIWPAASRRLLRVLEQRGLDSTRAEDLVQEVGVRAMASGVTFDGLDDFLWWAVPVVRNLHIDLLRSAKWSISAAELPDRECPEPGVDHVVERRLALHSVLTHLSAMPEGDRDVIVAAATDAAVDGARPGTVAVRRHRARAHLRRMVGTALGLAGAGLSLRRLKAVGVTVSPVTAAAWVALPALAVAVTVSPVRQLDVSPSQAYVRPLAVEADTPKATAVGFRTVAGSAPAPAEAPVVRGVVVERDPDAPFMPMAPTAVEVKPAGDNGLRAERRESEGDEPLLCVLGGDYLHTRCLDQPVPQAQETVKANVSRR